MEPLKVTGENSRNGYFSNSKWLRVYIYQESCSTGNRMNLKNKLHESDTHLTIQIFKKKVSKNCDHAIFTCEKMYFLEQSAFKSSYIL